MTHQDDLAVREVVQKLDASWNAHDMDAFGDKPYALIRDIGGRQGDVLHLRGRDGAEIAIAPAQITACLRGSPVKQWQLRVTPDALSIACVCAASEFQEADIVSRLGAFLAASGAQPLPIRASQIDRLERGATGKAKLVTTLTR